ncbi:Protein ANTAGONIST OF LIKE HETEROCHROMATIN PROTEIN 1 [Frankliniella fusca]|uniref:Protein ANTAGONIST OF LIKE HETEROCHROMATIN PROTEIN 1 n=1 Tax=Frankliniella fusca TaxID=407009 RepID=A0AAE1I452_9NEOP|nr:Protein ANTAGONIST OF LIKE HETEROCHROMATIN PROTEIN 1 [Frankliniella fusca]
MRQQWGAWHTVIPHMREHDPEKFLNYFRMTPAMFDELHARVRPHLERRELRGVAQVDTGERLALTLRYLSSGDYQVSLSYAFLIPPASVSQIITETCWVLWEVLGEEVFPLPTPENFVRIAEEFEEKWNFPNLIGAIDGKHIETQPLPYVIVGDEAFTLSSHFMVPKGGQFLPDYWNIYNYRLSRARRVIENAFGIMTARWRVLRRCLQAGEEKMRPVVSACVVLHNFFVQNEENVLDAAHRYIPAGYVDLEEGGRQVPGRWRAEVRQEDNLLQPAAPRRDVQLDPSAGPGTDAQGMAVQRQFRDYFLSRAGRIPSQWEHMIHPENRA